MDFRRVRFLVFSLLVCLFILRSSYNIGYIAKFYQHWLHFLSLHIAMHGVTLMCLLATVLLWVLPFNRILASFLQNSWKIHECIESINISFTLTSIFKPIISIPLLIPRMLYWRRGQCWSKWSVSFIIFSSSLSNLSWDVLFCLLQLIKILLLLPSNMPSNPIKSVESTRNI